MGNQRYSNFLFHFLFYFEECPGSIGYGDQLLHMYHDGGSDKLQAIAPSFCDKLHHGCLDDPFLPNLILATYIVNTNMTWCLSMRKKLRYSTNYSCPPIYKPLLMVFHESSSPPLLSALFRLFTRGNEDIS